MTKQGLYNPRSTYKLSSQSNQSVLLEWAQNGHASHFLAFIAFLVAFMAFIAFIAFFGAASPSAAFFAFIAFIAFMALVAFMAAFIAIAEDLNFETKQDVAELLTWTNDAQS